MAVSDYNVTAVVNSTRPPSTNDVLPILCSALFSPLVQPLREVDRTSDLEVDVIRIRLVYGSPIRFFLLSGTHCLSTSDFEGVDVSWNICSGRCLRHFGSQRRLCIGMQIAGDPI